MTPPPHRYQLAAQCGVLALLLLGFAVSAQTRSVAGEVAISSSLIDRGMQIGPRRPIAQVQVTLYDTSGWSTGLAVGVQAGAPNPSQVLVRGAYEWLLSNDWQMQANALYYSYPSDSGLKLFDRVEAGVSWGYRDMLALSLTSHHFRIPAPGQPRPRWTAEMSLRWPLAEHIALSSGIGQAQLDRDGSYAYGQVGTTWSQGPWRAEVSYLYTDRRAVTLFGNNAARHWSVLLARSF
nr:hypothetical protein [uncultured Albidiferax sp.]